VAIAGCPVDSVSGDGLVFAMEQNESLSLRADLFCLHVKHRAPPSRYEHQEIHPMADNMSEGDRPDCDTQGTWPTLQSKSFGKGRSLAK
jgi:hypothetical protein